MPGSEAAFEARSVGERLFISVEARRENLRGKVRRGRRAPKSGPLNFGATGSSELQIVQSHTARRWGRS